MKQNLRKKATLLFCLFSLNIVAQNACVNSLYESNKLFESGKLQECVNLLEPCLKEKKDKEELIESYHLLAQAYQNLGNLEKANFYVKKMLFIKHDYQKFPNIDPIDFSRLINQYSVSPKLYFGVKFGFNRTSVNLKKSFAAYSSTQRYNPTIGFQLGITGEYRIKPLISLNADILSSGIEINHVTDNAGGLKQNYTEQQNYISILVNGQKSFKLSQKIFLYGGLGLGLNYMYNANVFFEATDIETKLPRQATQNPISSRNKTQTCANGIIGASVPLAQGTISFDANFGYFFGNTVNKNYRMKDLNFIFNNQYVNDDVSLRIMMLSICFKMPLVWSVDFKKER
jgi:tetratricopeptide (TPR) repeat protein